MSSISRKLRSRFGLEDPDVRTVLTLQLLLLLPLCVLLEIGFGGLGERSREGGVGSPVNLALLGWDALAWGLWLFAAPIMLVIVRRYRLGRERIKIQLAWWLFWSLGLYFFVANLRLAIRLLMGWHTESVQVVGSAWATYGHGAFSLWPMDLLTYGCFFMLTFSLDYHFRYRRRAEETTRLALQAARLESDLSKAELAALRGQLHPHFLFNSFNALATLVRQGKNEMAVEIIAQLSALLRLAIDRIGFQEVPLDKELNFVERYLQLEQVRFGEKLRVSFAIESSARGALVPNIFLQPIVENAIKHGISLMTTPGEVRIAAKRDGERLVVQITNDGPEDLSPRKQRVADKGRLYGGIGEANTRLRLEKQFGPNYRLERQSRNEGGAIVTLELPWRHEIAPAAPTHESN